MEQGLAARRLLKLCLFAAFGVFVGTALRATEVTVFVSNESSTLAKTLRNASAVLPLAEDEAVGPQDILAAARADYSRLISALYEAGYYSGVISILVDGREAADLSPVQAPPVIRQVVVRIDPGSRFVFSRASIQPRAPKSEPTEGFAVGEPARSTVIARAARDAVAGWRTASHAKAEVTTQRLIANHPTGQLSADIVIDPGPALRFGELRIERAGDVRPDRIRDMVALPEGAPFSPEVLEDANDRLRRTGTFRSVVLAEAEDPSPDGTLDIIAQLEAAKPRRITFGAEIESVQGISLSASWMHRNILGGAERLLLSGEISGIGGDIAGSDGGVDYRVQVRFERPSTFTPDTDLFLSMSLERNDEPEYRETFARIGGGVTHKFSDTLKGELGIAYQYSDVRDALGTRELQHLFLPGRLTWDLRDNDLDPRSGRFLDLQLTPFLGLDDTSGTGVRVYADARGYLGLGKDKRFVLAGRTQLGALAGAGVTSVPPGMLFFSGGAGTVRGQEFQSLGVPLPNGDQIGGRSFLGFSGELRADLNDPWQVVGFYDAGFIGADPFSNDRGRWQSGAGVGVRYKTSLGPIRFDLAFPVRGESDNNFEIYLGIGQAF
ncbi:MAG: autotransporter assembly complex family protein [Pseudomonadota bacterium]